MTEEILLPFHQHPLYDQFMEFLQDNDVIEEFLSIWENQPDLWLEINDKTPPIYWINPLIYFYVMTCRDSSQWEDILKRWRDKISQIEYTGYSYRLHRFLNTKEYQVIKKTGTFPKAFRWYVKAVLGSLFIFAFYSIAILASIRFIIENVKFIAFLIHQFEFAGIEAFYTGIALNTAVAIGVGIYLYKKGRIIPNYLSKLLNTEVALKTKK